MRPAPGLVLSHNLDEWLRDDGPTDLDNLALLCRRRHDVHEGGQVLERGSDGGWTVRLGLPPREPQSHETVRRRPMDR